MTINIRSIQHYMYCPRRFGLLEINNDWAENAYVVKANIMHENVHSSEHSYKTKLKHVLSSVAVYNDLPELDLYGIIDCIEFIKDPHGTFIDTLKGNYNVKIIEYKPQKPKNMEYNETDAIQVYAQKLCADYVWNCNSECYIYYSNVKQRVKLNFSNIDISYYNSLVKMLSDMRNILTQGIIPLKKKGQKCSGCSLKDICMPKCIHYNIKEQINSLIEKEVT